MIKKELKHYLNMYPMIRTGAEKKFSCVETELYGRKRKIEIPMWTYNLDETLAKIAESEKDVIISQIIEKVYRQGETDKRLITRLPVTESSYYRLKRKIEEKIYELYIANGSVTENEILSNKICE